MSTLRELSNRVYKTNTSYDCGTIRLYDKSVLVHGHQEIYDKKIDILIRFFNGKISPDSDVFVSCTCEEFKSCVSSLCPDLESFIRYSWPAWFDQQGNMLPPSKLLEDYSKLQTY